MGVSAAQGSAGLKPGVCTSTTRPSNPFEGQMIYETDTDLTYIYGGSAWQQVSGGTAVGNSGLVYVTGATIGTGVSSVTVSSAFSTTYDNYKVILTGGVASGSPDLQVQLGSTVTQYYYTSLYNRYNASTATGLASANQTSWRYSGSGTSSLLQADIELFNPFLTKVTLLKANMNQYAADGLSMFTQGFVDNSTSYTAFTISPTAGTITGGTITVYGYRKA